MIVGENGTGKSNLFDAILFVLGRRNHELRVRKLADLINRAKNANEARVSLVFDYYSPNGGQPDASDEMSDEAFKLTRWINKEGKNGYYINEMKANLEEMATFLMERGLDLQIRHNIIAQ